ncbi:hypothetical protein [Streptomyces sp. NPDC047525]|uniref:hypothetical protein n=1 Tax=Streptomyces sp. NPDC047525 TaxID=3155264 RepID=UPI0033E1A7E7
MDRSQDRSLDRSLDRSQQDDRLDVWLPVSHWTTRHDRYVAALPAVAARALREVTPGEMRLVRPLVALRTLPSLLAGKGGGHPAGPADSVHDMTRAGFIRLDGGSESDGPESDGSDSHRPDTGSESTRRESARPDSHGPGSPAESHGPDSPADSTKPGGGDRPSSDPADGAIILGFVGQPWKPVLSKAILRGLTPEEFLAFDRPGYLKGVYAMWVEPDGAGSRLRTETRVFVTSQSAARRFKPYWTLVEPFSGLIRRDWLAAVGRRAERAA